MAFVLLPKLVVSGSKLRQLTDRHNIYFLKKIKHLRRTIRRYLSPYSKSTFRLLTKLILDEKSVVKTTSNDIFHLFQDIAAGLLLATGLVSVLIPVVDQLDGFLLTSQLSPFLVIASSILVIVFHPNADKWTPTR